MLVVDADCLYSTSGQGLHRSVDPVDKEVYLYSQFETADAQRVFACFDQPDLKAVFTCHVTVPAHWKVISNMPVDPAGEGDTWHFPPTPRMSTYITAACAGPYHEVRDEHDGIDLGVFCRQSMERYLDADDLFLITKQGFDFFHGEFGVRYPLPKYDQLWLPDFNAGAMENFGCVTHAEPHYIFRSQVTDFEYEQRANTILHELAHMWFGDLVTMRWWNDLWLNESFAEWASHWCNTSATRFTDAWTTFLSIRKNWGYRQDQLSSTHPVYCEMPDVEAVEVNFDGITYAKGACVIKQLVAYVGLDAFRTGLRDYFAAHRGATPPSTTCSPRWRPRPAGNCASSPPSGWRPRRSTRCGRTSTSRRTAPTSRWPSCRRRRPTIRRCAPTGSASASTTCATAPSCGAS